MPDILSALLRSKGKLIMNTPILYCGYVAIIGRPNVGKSTLLNHLIGQKLCITSPKPQTTRHRILGIKTDENVQTIFVDTPGINQKSKLALNRYLNRAALRSIVDVDVIVWVVEALQWRNDDAWILENLADNPTPVILVVNKVDKVAQKGELLPFIEDLQEKRQFAAIIPVSARKGDNLTDLTATIEKFLPERAFEFPEDQLTDRSERFLAAEMIREKLLLFTQQEVPHSLTVEIELFKREEEVLHISATIWVEKPGQKPIVIGKGGEMLKKIGTRARLELEDFFQIKIMLKLWVKVKDNWSDDQRALRSLGYEE